jgi:hypothetical protein
VVTCFSSTIPLFVFSEEFFEPFLNRLCCRRRFRSDVLQWETLFFHQPDDSVPRKSGVLSDAFPAGDHGVSLIHPEYGSVKYHVDANLEPIPKRQGQGIGHGFPDYRVSFRPDFLTDQFEQLFLFPITPPQNAILCLISSAVMPA